MPLAFSASQQLQLGVSHQADLLASYLAQEERVVNALLDSSQLERLGPGRYRYSVTHLQLFKLPIHPVVELRTQSSQGLLELEALDCELEGLGLVEDFELTLSSWLRAGEQGLEGEATLAVQISQPPLLKLIPAKLLEAAGKSLLSGVLLGIKTRVGHQLLADFRQWCKESPRPTTW